MITHYYSAIKDVLIEKVPQLEIIDWYLNQFEQDGTDHLLGSPAAFIQFFDVAWETLTNKSQRSPLKFRVYLVSKTTHGNENDMLDHINVNHPFIESLIFTALNNKSFLLSDILDGVESDGQTLSNITRVNSNFHHRISNLIVTYQDFECIAYDYSALPSYQKVLAELCLDVRNK